MPLPAGLGTGFEVGGYSLPAVSGSKVVDPPKCLRLPRPAGVLANP